MVERTALEMRRTREGTVGSNPTLSAIYLFKYCPERASFRVIANGRAVQTGPVFQV